MTPDYIKRSLAPLVAQGRFPSLEELENNSWDFETIKGFQFSYTLAEFIIQRYGSDPLRTIIGNSANFEAAFHCSAAEFHAQWTRELQARLR